MADCRSGEPRGVRFTAARRSRSRRHASRPRCVPALRRTLGDIRDNLRTRRELVLDARSAERFHARVPEPRPGLRGGHVPGARNLPFGELLTPQQTLLPPAALRARFAAAGVDERSEVITSCGSGLTAAVLNLGLARRRSTRRRAVRWFLGRMGRAR